MSNTTKDPMQVENELLEIKVQNLKRKKLNS